MRERKTHDGALLFGGFVALLGLVALFAYGGAVGYTVAACVVILVTVLVVAVTR